MRTSSRHPIVRALLALGAAVLAGVLFAGPAVAQTDDDLTENDQIVLNGRLTVLAGETVDTAVIFNGPATVDGTVTEALVVFNGDVVVTGTVGGDVVVTNGAVTIRSSAEIGGNLVTRQTPDVEDGATIRGERRGVALDGADAAWIGFASRIAWWIAYSASTLVLGLLLILFAPRLDPAIALTARERTGAAIGIGAAFFFLLPIVAALLLVTVIGIPLGIFLLLGLALIYTVGYVAGAHALGRFLIKPPASPYLAFLAGWAVLRVIGLIPVLGGLAWLAFAIFGLGVLVVAARATASGAVVAPPTPPAPLETPTAPPAAPETT
jgi:hypothetical protein